MKERFFKDCGGKTIQYILPPQADRPTSWFTGLNAVFNSIAGENSPYFSQFCPMLKFGSKVVCINDVFTEEQKAMIPSRPVKDAHYTIDEVLITRMGKAVTLVELNNPPLMHPSGAGTFIPSFNIKRFRELDEAPEVVVEEALQEAV